MKRTISLVLAFALLVTAVGCSSANNKGGNTTQTAPAANTQTETKTDTSTTETTEAAPADTASGELEPYTFSVYYNYDWWGIKPWGDDAASKFLAEKFNVKMEQSKPDADADAKLNIMISADDLPDVVVMDRGPVNINLARLGKLQDLAPFQANNSDYNDNILPQTQKLLQIDGKLYGIPNWARKAPTGGNDAWIYNKRIYEAAGSPQLKTFEDLYAFAKAIKEKVPTTAEGAPTIPFATDADGTGHPTLRGINRSMGGKNLAASWYVPINGKFSSALRDDTFKAAVMEANKWYREGLLLETSFTDTKEQHVEKMVAGRTGLMYYDFSQNDVNKFRTILKETYPDDDYIVLTDPYVYPPANGISADKIYPDHKETVGWNVNCITTKATNPQRIFDLYSYMITKEGSINMMYGPKGDLWDDVDANGNPVLKKPESSLSSDEVNRLGLWFWPQPAHSDNVDMTKFAVNEMQPEDQRSWVISIQANVLSPIMFMSDEYVGVGDVIDKQSDLGIKRTLCEDQIKAEIPKIMMAKSEAEATKIYDALLAFVDKNGMPDIEAAFDVKYQENLGMQGGTAYNR